MVDFRKLPLPYVDCVVRHRDGSTRIARLDGSSKHWQLSTYMRDAVKYQYAWSLTDVVAWRVVDMDLQEGVCEGGSHTLANFQSKTESGE